MTVATKKAQQRLAALWLGGSCLVIVSLSLQMALHVYDQPRPDSVTQAWTWLATRTQLFPTVTLMLGALFHVTKSKSRGTVDPFAFTVCLGLSGLYFIVMLSVVFYASDAVDPVQHLERWTLPLGAIQTLLGIPLGYFFTAQTHST